MRRCVFILSVFLCANAHAELKWDQTTVEVHPAFGAKQAVGHFAYENVGAKPVRITSVHPSCGCTATRLTKNLVEPGEKGEITAIFTIGDRIGTQVRDITVQSEDPEQGHVTAKLLLQTFIAPPLEVRPLLVYWNGGEEPKSKAILVKGAKGSIRSIKVTVSDTAFVAGFKPVGDSEFKVDVHPLATTKSARATISIQPDGSPKIFTATAVVTGKAAPPTAMSQ